MSDPISPDGTPDGSPNSVADGSRPERPAESLMRVTREGGGEAAVETMLRTAPHVASGVRRAIPFLGRRGIVVTHGTPSLINSRDLGEGLTKPRYIVQCAVEPGGARAALCFDGPAIGFLVEGALGGDGSDPPTLHEKGLSAPQKAFMARLGEQIVFCISTATTNGVGLGLTTLPPGAGEKSAGGPMVILPLSFEARKSAGDDEEDDFGFDDDEGEEGEQEAAQIGEMVLAISKHALYSARAINSDATINPRIAATLAQVEVMMVGELGRITMTLGEMMMLAPGDTLRLDVPVNGTVDVRMGEQVLFRAHPTTAGSQLALQLVEQMILPPSEEAQIRMHEDVPTAAEAPKPKTPSKFTEPPKSP